MRKSIALSVLGWLLAFAPAEAAIGTPVLIQSAQESTASGSPTAGHTGVDAPPGSLVIISVQPDNANVAVTGCSDSAGNSYAIVEPTPVVAIFTQAMAWSITTIDLPIGSSFTCTTSSAQTWETTGAWATSGATGGIDTTTTLNQLVPGTSASIVTGTLATNSEIVFGLLGFSTSATTYTESSGFTNLAGAGAGSFGGVGYQIVAATTSITFAPSFGSVQTYSTELVSFKATAALTNHNLSLIGVGK